MNGSKVTPIRQFYANTKIFITGGTGFLGIILIEKLLRSCPDIQTIYLLVRNKEGIDGETRLSEILNDVIFQEVEMQNPNYKDKVIGIYGDCGEPELGINKEDRNTLIKEVNIVFHVASTVSFNENLQTATLINVRGTRDVINLSKQMKNLKFITHVSTSYVHNQQSILEEKFYESPYKVDEWIEMAESLPTASLVKNKPRTRHSFSNNYTFTKSVAEEMIKDCDLPIAVLRPAIIVSTLNEPMPGWINNYDGPQGISITTMLGIVHNFRCNNNVRTNIIPVDMCANALIAIPWHCRTKYEESLSSDIEYEVPIYHYESSTYRPINWKQFRQLAELYGELYPPIKIMGEYFVYMNKRHIVHTVAILLTQYLPALFIYGILKCIGKKHIIRKAYTKIDSLNNTLQYFYARQWNYKSDNLVKLCDSMSADDKALFFCDLRALDWQQFFRAHILGYRKYLKEDRSIVDEAMKRLILIKLYTRAAIAVIIFLLCAFVYFAYRKIFRNESLEDSLLH